MPFFFGLFIVPPLYYAYKYRGAIKKRIREIEEHRSNLTVTRDTSGKSKKRVRCLELNPSFLDNVKDDCWQLMSLGQYLSQLRPSSDDSNQFLKKELEMTIGKQLLALAGNAFGAALLPILGTSAIDGFLSKVAASMASYAAKQILSEEDIIETTEDVAALDLELPELIAFLNINQKLSSPIAAGTSSLDLLKIGDVGYGDLSFHDEDKHERGFPSPFVMERDFKKCITDMEEETLKKNGTYDPNDKSLPPPTPINERILPDLYLGTGDAKCTHTNRECLENRLVGFLLTRLSHNFYKKVNGDKDLFEVHWNGAECRFPEELIQAFMNTGHNVEICPKATTASFGAFVCVKEEDGSFSNIPLCVQLRTGVERASDGRPAYFVAPHGGLEINIRGPFIGSTNYCAVQFYVASLGCTAFYANHDVDLPWLKRTALSEMYSKSEAITAVRMAGMVAHVFNSIGTDLNLPFGGYGVLGMCNDSATIIDYAIRGKTSAYPLLATGRYLNHIFQYFLELREGLKRYPEMKRAASDLKKLTKATMEMPNDLHVSPSTVSDFAARFCSTYSKPTFQMTEDSKSIVTEVATKVKGYTK